MNNFDRLCLDSGDKTIASQIWLDLQSGLPEAQLKLVTVSESIRMAILGALSEAIDRQVLGLPDRNPFE
ncbi:hypothetical protein EON80_06870 [bacterium]|nr:MAG: hypothetical protein EON80_06870 [bacterium]